MRCVYFEHDCIATESIIELRIIKHQTLRQMTGSKGEIDFKSLAY